MLLALIAAALASQVQIEPQVPIGPQVPPQPTLRLPARTPTDTPAKPAEPDRPRVPIDLGPDAPQSEPPQQIDILAPALRSEAANEAVLKECEDQREAGVVAGEIVVCRELEVDTSQLYSGSREAWLKNYAERTQNAGTIPAPDVAGAGIFRGPATAGGMCFVPPCPKGKAVVVDFSALPMAPPGSDAERAAGGLAPQGHDAPLSEEDRRRIEAGLDLPDPPAPAPAPEG